MVISMVHWVMVIDLNKCVGCMACVAACQIENFLPLGVSWGRVVDFEDGKYPSVERVFLPMPCMHCEEAPCVKVCPTEATFRREDGVVLIDYDKCIGCRLCMIACPYDSRIYFEKVDLPLFFSRLKRDPRSKYQKIKEKVVAKCTFCVHRIDKRGDGKVPGRDPEVTPICVNVCNGHARYFGDLDDPESEASKILMKERKRVFVLYEKANTKPSVYYLRRIKR